MRVLFIDNLGSVPLIHYCTHKPNVIGAAAGANLLWAEAGSNPQDTEQETEGQRGMTVKDSVKVLEEAEWKVLQGPSKFYGANPSCNKCL
jgi:biotin synthase